MLQIWTERIRKSVTYAHVIFYVGSLGCYVVVIFLYVQVMATAMETLAVTTANAEAVSTGNEVSGSSCPPGGPPGDEPPGGGYGAARQPPTISLGYASNGARMPNSLLASWLA